VQSARSSGDQRGLCRCVLEGALWEISSLVALVAVRPSQGRY
jgi:hypothetical protein